MSSHGLGRTNSYSGPKKDKQWWFKKVDGCTGAFTRRMKDLTQEWLQMNSTNGQAIYVDRELLHGSETIERLLEEKCHNESGSTKPLLFKSTDHLTTFDVPFATPALVTFLEFLVAKRETDHFTPNGTLRAEECSEMFKIASYFAMSWCFKEITEQFGQYLQGGDMQQISRWLGINRDEASQGFSEKMLDQIYREGLFDAQDQATDVKLARFYPGHAFPPRNKATPKAP
ncbi:unnamed protein product, partial [Mesorhabditis belari]|uniref:Uncharacterized protein n=1 Tax=Mesorhabditis belari TaxID=2138241 RepID=A0AAF3J5T0_9BILA